VPADVTLHPAAAREVEVAYNWYLVRNPIAASAFQAELEHAVAVVADQPARWPKLNETVRRYVFPRFPFSLIFREAAGEVEIIAIAHQKRRPGYWTKR